MRDKLNCPNCGAPIDSTQCPYCGTVFFDFAAIDTEKPTYIRVKHQNHLFTFKALMRDAEVIIDRNGCMALNGIGVPLLYIPSYSGSVDFHFEILPDDLGCLLQDHKME